MPDSSDPEPAAGRERVLAAVETQIGWCRRLGSPFTAGVLEAVRDNIDAAGSLAALVVPWPGRPTVDAVALRLAAALHALVRAGRAPELAVFYPPTSAPWDATAVGQALERTVAARQAEVRDFVAHPPQTNEVGRSAILMPGYVEVARLTGLPLVILELGASAGLNLLWDRFAYRLGTLACGPPGAAVTIEAEWRGAPPAITSFPRVARRAACDRAPIDLDAAGAAERLIAYVWPDQSERVRRLEAAIALARAVGTRVENADAAAWLERELALPAAGAATVVAHTIVWQYFPAATAERVRATLAAAGARATPERPLAWLAFEHTKADAPPELALTLWPGDAPRTLACAHPHGAWVDWK